MSPLSDLGNLDNLGADDVDDPSRAPVASDPPSSGSLLMNTIEFLLGFWPVVGIYVIVTGPHPSKKPGRKPSYWHNYFDTVAKAAAFVTE